MATHHFKPDHYHVAMGTYDPVLRIADGDTVITTTVDARGKDSSGEQITPAGNPQTGPFYIEDAAPGDTLAVHLDRLSPNRSRGWSSSRLAPHVVDPWHVEEFPPRGSLCEWEIDLEGGMAILDKPATKLGRLKLPLRPMLGCFGVAPGNSQAISTATSGPHGGNMDYKGFETGAMVYFPVAVEGALLFVGDGHAVQGDGEIAGTGIEISFDVQLTVKLLKGKTIAWPRGENQTHILTAGNARPLDQALQHATSEMVRWLEADYGLDSTAVHILLGQCVEYEVGNVFDPAYTMICKVSKELLARLRP